MTGGAIVRFVDYDTVAAKYDRRYALHDYGGIRDAMLAALPPHRPARTLELGCGTGRWVALLAENGCEAAGIDPSEKMLEIARRSTPGDLRCGRAEALPWASGAFDVVFCINALHHFERPGVAIAEAARVLRAGGTFLSVGLDPHAGRDRWWVYDFFPSSFDTDCQRFAGAERRLAWVEAAGLVEPRLDVAERLRSSRTLAEAKSDGTLERSFTSQLTVLSDDEYASGVSRIEEAARRDPDFVLESDLTLVVTTARKA